jgi:hypothetical protein
MAWDIRCLRGVDLPLVSSFFRRVLSGEYLYGSQELFHWKIFNNIYSVGCLNAIEVDGAIVSTTSLTPKRLVFRGQNILAAEIGDTYTDEAFQRRGMFADLVNHTRLQGHSAQVQFIYGTPNQNSLPGYEKKANFKKLSTLDVRSLSLPMGMPKRLSLLLPSIIRDLADYILRVAILLRVFAKNFWKFNRGFTVTQNSQIDENQWNEFWQKAVHGVDACFDRSYKAKNWRYDQSPNSYDTFLLWRDKILVGYVVTRKVVNDGIPMLVIADCMVIAGFGQGIRCLLWKVFEKALNENLKRINSWLVFDSWYFHEFINFGFFCRDKISVISYFDDTFKMIDANSTRWHFTIGDSDNV